jgi:hypothetical protein
MLSRVVLSCEPATQAPWSLIEADAPEQFDEARDGAKRVQQGVIAQVHQPRIADPARLLEFRDCPVPLVPLRMYLGLLVQDAVGEVLDQTFLRGARRSLVAAAMLDDSLARQPKILDRLSAYSSLASGNLPSISRASPMAA